jgi:hypothetical protein
MPCKGLEIEHSDFEKENLTLKCNYLCQDVVIVIGSMPTVFEIGFMSIIMSFGGVLLQGSVLMNLIPLMRHQVDLQKINVGI